MADLAHYKLKKNFYLPEELALFLREGDGRVLLGEACFEETLGTVLFLFSFFFFSTEVSGLLNNVSKEVVI